MPTDVRSKIAKLWPIRPDIFRPNPSALGSGCQNFPLIRPHSGSNIATDEPLVQKNSAGWRVSITLLQKNFPRVVKSVSTAGKR
jgi:hypothetical protein